MCNYGICMVIFAVVGFVEDMHVTAEHRLYSFHAHPFNVLELGVFYTLRGSENGKLTH